MFACLGRSDSRATNSSATLSQVRSGLGVHEGLIYQEALGRVVLFRVVMNFTRPIDNLYAQIVISQKQGSVFCGMMDPNPLKSLRYGLNEALLLMHPSPSSRADTCISGVDSLPPVALAAIGELGINPKKATPCIRTFLEAGMAPQGLERDLRRHVNAPAPHILPAPCPVYRPCQRCQPAPAIDPRSTH